MDSPRSTFASRLLQAQRWHLEGRWEEAGEAYRALQNESPDHPQLLYLHGTLLLQRGQPGVALHLLRAAVSAQPGFAQALANLGAASFQLGLLDQARRAYADAERLEPHNADVQASLAALYVNEGAPERVLAHARAALERQPDLAVAHWNSALAHLELGHWEDGWREFEWGFATGDRLRKRYAALGDPPPWNGGAGQRVLVYGEMGLGDEILFASCLPDLAAISMEVIFDCHPRLEALFSRSFPMLKVIGARKEEWNTRQDVPAVDATVAAGSLPGFFRGREEAFPPRLRFLAADPARVAHYRGKLSVLGGPRPWLALAWQGGTVPTRTELRSVPLEGWRSVLAAPGTFVSVQYTEGAAEEAANVGVAHWQEAVDDLDEMAALIAACDGVISVCQTAVHLAGALGVPCWCLTPSKPAWRYGLTGERMIWYPSVRLFRQSPGDSWADVLERVGEALRGWPRDHLESIHPETLKTQAT